MTIPVEESADFAEKFIEVNWSGTPANGYRLLGINVFPPSVLVQGLPTRLSQITQISTEPIDITGLTGTFTQTVTLALPAGISLDEVQVVSVVVEIEPIFTTSVYNRPIEVIGLSRDLTAALKPDQVRVVLFGPLPVLDSLSEDEVRVTVDVFGLTAGTYNLEPDVDLPERGIELRSVQPPLVTVSITANITDTQTNSFKPTPSTSRTIRPSLLSPSAQYPARGLVWSATAVPHFCLLPKEENLCLINH